MKEQEGKPRALLAGSPHGSHSSWEESRPRSDMYLRLDDGSLQKPLQERGWSHDFTRSGKTAREG